MGKKKVKANPAGANSTDSFKDAGNKAFMAKDYNEAVKQYSVAIEMSKDSPNTVYFANRANAYLELKKFNECV